MAQPPLLMQATQGQEQAIASLVNQRLETLKINTKVKRTASDLYILLEAPTALEPNTILPAIYRLVLDLTGSDIQSVQVYAKRVEAIAPDWTETCSTNRRFLLKQLANHGDVGALATLINRRLVHLNISAEIQLQPPQLDIFLKSAQIPNPNEVITLIRRELAALHIDQFETVRIAGLHANVDIPAWTHEFTRRSLPRPSLAKPALRRSSQELLLPEFDAFTAIAPQRPQWRLKFDPFKLGFLAVLASYGLFSAHDYSVQGVLAAENVAMLFIHGVNLIMHEAGRILFFPFGQFLHTLGGSLMQILVPALISIYFVYTRQHYASAVTLCWVGENFWDISIDIKDAQEQLIPVLGNETIYPDWHYLLLQLNWLHHAPFIGNILFTLGAFIYAIAILLGAYYAQRSIGSLSRRRSLQDSAHET